MKKTTRIKPIKGFDCVEMKRKGAAAARAKMAGMTDAQKLEVWHGIYMDMVAKQKKLLKKSKGK